MKSTKHILVFFILISIFIFQSCSENKTENKTENEQTEKEIEKDTATKNQPSKILDTAKNNTTTKHDTITTKNEKTYKYICPMSCKQGHSDNKGNCPECGMEFIENPNYETK